MDERPCIQKISEKTVTIHLNNIKLYIINLEESRTRWIQCCRRMCRFFDARQIHRVPGIDGRSFATLEHANEWAPDHLKQLQMEGLIAESIYPDPIRTALCLSHQRALRTFLDDVPLGGQEDFWALILEDDARPAEALTNTGNNNLSLCAPDDADILFLHDRVTGGSTLDMSPCLAEDSIPVLWKPVTGGIGLEAYLINPAGAKKMLDAWKPLHFECDLQLMTFSKDYVKRDFAEKIRVLRQAAGIEATPLLRCYMPHRPLVQIDESIPSVKMGLLKGDAVEDIKSSSVMPLEFDTTVPIAFATCWFNPQHYRARLDNFLQFITQVKAPNLVVIELAFGDDDWQLPDDLPNLIRLRSNTLCWQKEALLNHAFRLLDDHGFSYLGWLDADVVFQTVDWVARVLEALQEKHLVQVFETVSLAFPDRGVERLAGAAASWVSGAVHPCSTGITGFGWAMRSKVWRQAGLYDYGLLGGGDSVMWRGAFYGRLDDASLFGNRNDVEGLRELCSRWAKVWADAVGMQIGYASGVEITALPHGKESDRRYMTRGRLLQRYEYIPLKHMHRDTYGLLQWADSVPVELKNVVATYFGQRNEDYLG